MITLREKLAELRALPPDELYAQGLEFLARAADWPVKTQVDLNEVAFVVAALLTDASPNVRRMKVGDAVRLTEDLG